KVGQEYQRLQVVGESSEAIGIPAVIGVAFERVAHFHDAVVVAVDQVVDKGIVQPLAQFVRESRDILRERSNAIHVGGHGVGLATGLSTVGAVVPADAAAAQADAARGQVDVVGDEDGQSSGGDLLERLH